MDPVSIAPITIVVGENSSGKTSFLAGLRYAIETVSRSGQNSFNREPFYLGAFDQIAYSRSNKPAGQFGFFIEFNVTEVEKLRKTYMPFMRKNDISGPVSYKLQFKNVQSQPTMVSSSVSMGDLRFEFDRGDKSIVRMFEGNRKVELEFEEDSKSGVVESISTKRNQLVEIFYAASEHMWRQHEERRSKSLGGKLEELELHQRLTQAAFLLRGDVVYASAPFRTRPERTYSPIEADNSAEGAHVPILLAQAKAFAPGRWATIKRDLEDFGKRAGMFSRIDIKKLGRPESDPFQILITIENNRSNIIDVGYGVSQILPLITEMLVNEDAHFFLFQQPEVHLHPRGQAELGSHFVEFALRQEKYVIVETHSDFLIDRVRSDLVRKGVEVSEALSILFFERRGPETIIHPITVSPDGEIKDPPPSYREFFLHESLRNFGL